MCSRFLVFFVFAVTISQWARAVEIHPRWIWGSVETDEVESAEPVKLVCRFETESTASAAVIRFAPMSASLTISLDGKVIASAEPFDAIREIDIESRMEAGSHEIIVDGRGVAGPSAFFLQLELRFNDGSQRTIVTDADWRHAAGGAADDLGPIDRKLIVSKSRRVGIDVIDNYEQWRQALGADAGTNPASFLLAPGFEIELIRSALPEEDSWVSLVFDSQGRALIAKEQAGLLRMTLADDGAEITEVESLAETLKECRGLVFIGDDLFVNANNSKGLYKLAAEGDGFAKPELIYESGGGVGHGRNDLSVGPDGELYSIQGDAVDLPTDAIDFTSPFRDARRGKKTSEGHLLRIDPESGEVEVLAAGLRNPFGIDFNEDGEIFTYDADAEYDMGSPWYRPTRVSQLVTGGDYGWRGVTKSWPPYYPDHPDNAQPALDIGKGSPTAVKFGTRSHFPRPYRDALFILDWAYGRIIAVHMVPRGSSYLMAAETFLKGRPLNVTDLDFAADGSMYLVTGGRKTQSALYRIRYVGEAAGENDATTPFQRASSRYAARSRALRRRLESHMAPLPDALDVAWPHLSSDDPGICYAARTVVEHQPIETWQDRVLHAEIRPALQSLIALARSCEETKIGIQPLVLRRLNELMPELETSIDRRTALQAYWLCLRTTTFMNDDDELRAETVSALAPEYPSRSIEAYEENGLLSEILVKLEVADVVPKTIRLLNAASEQAEQMHYLFVLRNVRSGWTIEDRRAFFAGLARAQHYLGGAGMSDFLKRIRQEAVATLDPSERQQLGTMIEDELPFAEIVPSQPRALVRQWTVEDLLDAGREKPAADASRGAKVFAEASCIQCHRFGSRGTLIGPDLTSASGRFSRRDLLVSIIEPSKVIAENYRSLQVVTLDGKTHVGQATLGGDYRSPTLRLATDPAQPFRAIEIPKTEIESQQMSEVSWMPKGLLDTFTRGEIFDLLAYLQSSP